MSIQAILLPLFVEVLLTFGLLLWHAFINPLVLLLAAAVACVPARRRYPERRDAIVAGWIARAELVDAHAAGRL